MTELGPHWTEFISRAGALILMQSQCSAGSLALHPLCLLCPKLFAVDHFCTDYSFPGSSSIFLYILVCRQCQVKWPRGVSCWIWSSFN